jgi:hypothetical protein
MVAQISTFHRFWMVGEIATLFVGIYGMLTMLKTQAQSQSQSDSDQNAALQAVAKMTEGQRTYYQTNGNFR